MFTAGAHLFSLIFTSISIPFIPVEYAQQQINPRLDFKADIWAFATTMWQIFSCGRLPPIHDVSFTSFPPVTLNQIFLSVPQFIQSKRVLPQPLNCPPDIYRIMQNGWDPQPERRFAPQMIFPLLIKASMCPTMMIMNCVCNLIYVRCFRGRMPQLARAARADVANRIKDQLD